MHTRARDIELDWDEARRLAVLGYVTTVDATGAEARALIDALTPCVGTDRRLFGLLSDGAKVRSVDAEYRSLWGSFFRQHRDHAIIALHSVGPVIRIAAEMFGIGAGVQLKVFSDEAAARVWLREKGIDA